MNFIPREEVISIIKEFGDSKAETLRRVKNLPSFPAPNPGWKHSDRNIMGQTEEEFWEAIENQDK